MGLEDDHAARSRFLVELTADGPDDDDIESIARRCRQACAEVGGDVRLIRSVFVPEDGRCLLVFEAGAAATVVEAVRAAGLAVTSVVEAIRADPTVTGDGTDPARPGALGGLPLS